MRLISARRLLADAGLSLE